ncbi:MAG: HD domain-containing protein [Chitinivibrionales bacterium]|nr:HD domain-containing protein [Chitinivibrionales bacterium]MBD3394784.1 HD domain-containing protein [Chitinivibrionales bacterium]
MKSVSTARLPAGVQAETDYFSSLGELVIARGTPVDQAVVDSLSDSGMAELFVREPADADIEDILLGGPQSLDELRETGGRREQQPRERPRVLSLPAFARLKKGQAGFETLLMSNHAGALDRHMKKHGLADEPCGPAVAYDTAALPAPPRPEKHKNEMTAEYSRIAHDVRLVLNGIVDGARIEGDVIRNIAESLVSTFVRDRDMLLDLSLTDPGEDIYVYTHSVNTTLLAAGIAIAYGYSREQVVEIAMGSLLHDIGMLLVPVGIMKKQGGLTQDEWYEVQKHPILGLHLLSRIMHLPESVKYVAYQSHERGNGKGYPKQRTTSQIHRFAKVIQVADVYEALSSPRPYREAHIPYKSMEMVIKMTRQGLVSGEYAKALLANTSLFPVGSLVELSDQRRGKVVAANGSSFAKPVVSVLTDSSGALLPPGQRSIEDLSQNTQLQITRALSVEGIDRVGLLDGF